MPTFSSKAKNIYKQILMLGFQCEMGRFFYLTLCFDLPAHNFKFPYVNLYVSVPHSNWNFVYDLLCFPANMSMLVYVGACVGVYLSMNVVVFLYVFIHIFFFSFFGTYAYIERMMSMRSLSIYSIDRMVVKPNQTKSYWKKRKDKKYALIKIG